MVYVCSIRSPDADGPQLDMADMQNSRHRIPLSQKDMESFKMTAVDFAAFVDRLAQVSSEVILPFFRSSIGAEDKSRGGAFDPVTEADRGAEAAMRRLISQTFPAHGVIGEEYGVDRPDAEYVWVLDPIDGTKSFISGLPTWGTLIGLMHRGRPVYGMMSQPFTRERYFGDGKRTRIRSLATSRS